MVDFHVLGAVRVVDDDGGEVPLRGARQRRLLAILLLHRNDVVSTDRLAEAVFAGSPTPAAATTLRSYAARLRRVVENGADDPVLVNRAPGYLLRVEDHALDAARFEGLVADGRARLADDDPVGAASEFHQALEAWRGRAYEEFADEDWARPEAQRLGELRLVAEELLIDAELACGRATELISRLEVLVDENPLREAFRAKLMLALYRTGRQVEALRVMHDYRGLLAEEVGLDPSPELARLEHRILAHDEDLQLTEPAGRALRGYRLGERLGSGRDGTVFAARLAGVDRDLAIRVVPGEVADRPDVVRTFDTALRQVAALRHEAIVPIHDHWREPGAAYVVMRRMRGGTLRDRLDRGPLPVREVAELAARVGAALVAAAGQGIVHGRVTPENVLYDDAGTPWLADFAFAGDTVSEAHPGDVRAFAALVAEALAGRPAHGSELDEAPPSVADVLATALDGTGAPEISTFVPALVTALDSVAGVAARVGRPAPVNPYKGLRAFDETDADDFFGRRHLVEEILRRLADDGLAQRLVLVVGGSGSGKSSAVHAGLLPRIHAGAIAGSDRWFVTSMVPGASPFKELAESLSRVATLADEPGGPAEDGLADDLAGDERGIDVVLRRLVPEGGEVLLVVDQLEELFTMAGGDDQRAFLDGVMHAVSADDSRLRVVATLRADFYDRPLRFHRFGAAVRDATVTVPAMAAAELEAAITGPAERAGRRVEPAVVAELVTAVVDQPAALPSLQFTLYELADRSDGDLGLDTYRELGGVDGAIASRAEALYRSLDDDDRATVRRLFEQLVVISAEGEPTRRRTPRSELAALGPGESIDGLVDAWAQARLLTFDRNARTREPTVEVAHEALLREWPRLRGWIDEDRGAIVAAGHIRDAAEEWAGLDRHPEVLYRGTRLETALSQVGAIEDSLPATARAFLAASRAARDEEAQQEADRVARQARANRRLRVQLAALAVALVIALVGGLVAVDQRRRADDQRRRAEHQERVATARELAAASEANLDDDPELSVLLALEAVERTRGDDGSALPEAESALHHAVTASRIVMTVPGLGGAVDWSPDGTVFVTEGPEDSGLVDIRNAETGESVLSFTGHAIDINDVAFSADGSMLATTGDDGAARVWDADTGDELATVDGDGQVWGPSISPDGARLAAAWPDEGLVRVLDIASGETVREIPVGQPGTTSFSPDGERLAIAANLDGVVVVDVTSGDEALRIQPGSWHTAVVAWSPDGRWIASGGVGGLGYITDAATGEVQFPLAGHTGDIKDIDWRPEADRLATGSMDGTARVWVITDDGALELLAVATEPQRTGVWSVAFAPDGERLLTGDSAVTAAKIWDVGVSGGAEWANLPVPVDFGGSAAFTPDGRSVVATGDGVPAVVWDVATGTPTLTLGEEDQEAHPAAVAAFEVEASPDGGLVATATLGGPVRVWDAGTGDEVFTVGEVRPVTKPGKRWAWSRDGELLAVNRTDGERGWTTIVDRAGRQVAEIPDDDLIPLAVAFSPDGDRIVTTGEPAARDVATVDAVRIWDWTTGELVREIPTYAGALALDPRGDRLATADLAGGVSLWDAATGDRAASLSGHAGHVFDVAFTPDGRTVATGSLDGTVRLWSAESGEQQLVLRGHEATVYSVDFSPDGSQLVSTSLGAARVWALDLDDLTEIAEGKVTRALTDDECRQYLHVDRCPDA